MPESIIDLVNSMGVEEDEVKGIEFRNMFSKVTINDIELATTENGTLADVNDDDSNVLDDSFELNDDDVEEEAERDRVLDEIEENIDGNNEAQQDRFNSTVDKVSTTNGSEDVDDETDESAHDDKVKEDEDHEPPNEEESVRHDENVEEDVPDNESSSTAEVPLAADKEVNNDDEPEEVRKPRMRFEVQPSLGSYWGDGLVGAMMNAESAAANIMQEYGEMTASISTPQYNLKKGLRIFKRDGYKARVKKLRDNLIGHNCIRM